MEISKHLSLATAEDQGYLTDKELFRCLQKYQILLDMDSTIIKDPDKLIQDTEELFREIESDDEDDWNDPDLH